MSPEAIQILFWLLVTTIVMLAYELHESTKPVYCERCAHCQALKEQERQRRAEFRDAFGRQGQPFTWRDRDDDQKHGS